MRTNKNFLVRLVELGYDPTDDQALRLKKVALTLVPLIIGPAAFIWGTIYYLLGHPLSGSIPMSYAVISAASLIYFFKTKHTAFLQASQLILVLVLPFLLMWSLGGFALGSMVMVWAIFTPVAALMFFERRTATRWFLAYLALVVVSALIDDVVSTKTNPLPELARQIFYLLNLGAASAGLFLLVAYVVGEEKAAIETLQSDQETLRQAQSELAMRKERSDNLNRMLHAVLDNIPVRIFWKDTSLRYLGCNQLFANDAGKSSPQELVGQDDYAMSWKGVADLYRDDDQLVIRTRQSIINSEESQTQDDGSTIWLRISKVPLINKDGTVFGVLGTYEDITEEKNIAQELVASKQAAEAANVAKSTFLANMSHEIRTPMNAILGFAYLLHNEVTDPSQLDKLEKLRASATHLLGILNDILDLSKIEAGGLKLESIAFNVKAILDQSVSMMTDAASRKNLSLIEEIDPELQDQSLLGDPLRIRQILINFISNAIKFTQMGRVVVRAKLTRREADRISIHFEVEDSGIGISEEDKLRIFSAFEQAEAGTTRKFGGTGLGLAVAREFAHLMDGEVGVISQPQQGSTFWLSVSFQRCVAPPAMTSDVSCSVQAGAHILLVEDNNINQMISKNILEELGLVVDLAEHGGEAVEMAKHARYDLVLMDMQMPVMDGLEATRQIRAMGNTVPIVAMTANVFQQDKANCLAAGMNDFVGKPVDPDLLMLTLAKWIPGDT